MSMTKVVALVVALAVGGVVAAQPAAGADVPAVASAATASARAQRLNPPPPVTSVATQPETPIFPMQTTPRCAILDNFGDPRPGGRIHQGTDMLATLGQEVYAVVDGTLTEQIKVGDSNSSLSGNAWRLVATGSKTYYFFMHLSAFAPGLSKGSVVKQGQLIGYVGDTGDAGPGNYHLHFEVHPNGGAAVNALTVLTIPTGCTVS
jgi:murein DD-endopeptidase MepM/ murein hydrolase activator NlpD